MFIGGEPTLHPDLATFAELGLEHPDTRVEIFTNLAHVKPSLWELFSHPRLSLGTSLYSDLPEEHDTITTRKGSHARTVANIERAVLRRIPIRVATIENQLAASSTTRGCQPNADTTGGGGCRP
ncbi:radical SAM protein [Actinokineospora enzanensis]|uniref:radical SAM protein n=1 Tax=Actinokineospora enzanensis TaxID=155975 RepID=UPI0012EB7BF6|nr:hypothetical protein [Actinokineospora enzanensis]